MNTNMNGFPNHKQVRVFLVCSGVLYSWIFQTEFGQNAAAFCPNALLLGCPWKLVTIVSKLVYNLLRDLQLTYIGVTIHFLY